MPHQKYITGLVLCCTDKIHSDILLTPTLIFTGGEAKSARFGFNFLTPVAFDTVWFEKGATSLKPKTCHVA